MDYLDAIDSHASLSADTPAFINSRDESITYRELKSASDRLAVRIAQVAQPHCPVAVHGHKSPWMIVSFLAAVKSGHPYVVLESTFPAGRLETILGQLESPIVLDVADEPLGLEDLACATLTKAEIEAVARDASLDDRITDETWVRGEDLFYILFTSGSTGTPKGVEITANCVNNFYHWVIEEYPASGFERLFNKAPYSFDLSLLELAYGLGQGFTLVAAEIEADDNLGQLFEFFAAKQPTFFVATPSLAEICLHDPTFDDSLMPTLRRMVFAGEALNPSTTKAVRKRFSGIEIVNAYGPTESTNLVSSIVVTPEMEESGKPIPIGYAKPGTTLITINPETLQKMPAMEDGELVIIGNTVAKGYYRRPDLTDYAFHGVPDQYTDGRRSYRTGDLAAIDEDGLVYYRGRIDNQVKLHGYRVELGDIEAALCDCAQVDEACVVPVKRDGSISYLCAFAVPARGVEANYATTKALKAALGEKLPTWMVPRTVKYLDALPLSPNGKIDRRALTERANEPRR